MVLVVGSQVPAWYAGRYLGIAAGVLVGVGTFGLVLRLVGEEGASWRYLSAFYIFGGTIWIGTMLAGRWWPAVGGIAAFGVWGLGCWLIMHRIARQKAVSATRTRRRA